MEKMERRTFPVESIEIRSEEGQPTRAVGYAAVWEKLSVPLWGFREKIRKGAFTKSLEEAAKNKRSIKALWNHNSDMPLGNTKKDTLKLEEDDKGLRFELELPDNSWGRDAEVSIRRGDTDGVSFGFETEKDEWDRSDEKNVIRTLVQVGLHEISPTPYAAYPQTSLGVRSPQEVYESHTAHLQEQERADEIETRKNQARVSALRNLNHDILRMGVKHNDIG